MSTNLTTNYFRLHNVKQFKESISEVANTAYYVFTAKSTPYPDSDTVIPHITNSVQSTYSDPYRNMLFGKRVSPADVVSVTRRYNWTSNTVYTPYRSDTDLTGKPFYVCIQHTEGADFEVFKCLDNNGGRPSTDPPTLASTSADDEFYQNLVDMYVWKYMYSIPASTFSKFGTTDYMPVIPNANVVGNAVPGAVDLIIVNSGGSNYNTYLSNTFISASLRVGGNNVLYAISEDAHPDNDFYNGSYLYITSGGGAGQGRRIVDYIVVGSTKLVEIDTPFNGDDPPVGGSVYEITPGVLISGDGTGAEARALVNTASSNTIYSVQVLSRGRDYTYAGATVTGNTGGISNAASLSVIFGPKGGHGSDPEYELGATAAAISVQFANNEGNNIPVDNDYRQIGLLKDPLYSRVELSIGTPTGVFAVGDTITQANSSATGTVFNYDGLSTLELTDVAGVFVTGETVSSNGGSANVTAITINGESKNFTTFDQRYRYTYGSQTGTFFEDETIYQTDLQVTNAVFHSINNDYIYFTDVKGVLNTANAIIGQNSGATANLLFAYPPDLVVGSGEVLYIENKAPITRSNTQTETVKIILQF